MIAPNSTKLCAPLENTNMLIPTVTQRFSSSVRALKQFLIRIYDPFLSSVCEFKSLSWGTGMKEWQKNSFSSFLTFTDVVFFSKEDGYQWTELLSSFRFKDCNQRTSLQLPGSGAVSTHSHVLLQQRMGAVAIPGWAPVSKITPQQ